MIHVYGIAHAGTALPEAMEGLGDPPGPVRLVESGPIAAVVTDLAAAPRSRADLQRHADVQSRVVEQATLVPLRFGTLFEDEEELRRGLLEAHAEELTSVLHSVDGRVQMTLKAVYPEDLLVREVVREHPEIKAESDRLAAAGDRSGQIALGQRVAGAVEDRRAADESAIAARLDPVAEQVLVEEPGDERMAARLQLLVPREARPALDEAVAALAAEQEGRMTMRYVGPLAPYSFCDLSLEAGAAAWG